MPSLTPKQREALERAAAHPDGHVTETAIATRRRLIEAGYIADTGTEHCITAAGRKVLEPATQPDPNDIRFRAVENFSPGQWFLFEYEDENEDTGEVRTGEVWAEVRLVMHMEQIGTGRKYLRIRGVGTDGFGVELVADRGTQVQNVTARQAAKVGMVLPDLSSPDAARNPQPLPEVPAETP
jgi:hypothetical protein